MHTEVAYSSLCQTLYIPCVHHESSPLLPAIQWTNSMQRMLACFIQIDFLKLVYKRIIKFWFKLHLKIRPFSQKFLHLFEQVLRLHELVMPCYIDYSDANKLLISWTVKWLFFVYVQSLCKISNNGVVLLCVVCPVVYYQGKEKCCPFEFICKGLWGAIESK